LITLTAASLLLPLPNVHAQTPKPNASKAAYLAIGDPAPVLKSAKWLKGTPAPQFDKGRIYVVEFWATWCGPCKANIPHLTELAAKYKEQVSVIGISIWENAKPGEGDTLKRVTKFVKEQGAAMNYIVAADVPGDPIANAYMKAAGQQGIPCSFIVDRDGKIAWIGYPTEMDRVLEQMVAGKYDPTAVKAKQDEMAQLLRPIDEALAARQYPAAVTAIEQALEKKPDLFVRLAYPYLLSLFHADPAKGKTTARKILTDAKSPGAYQMIGSLFASQPDLSSESYRFGIEVLEEALRQWPADYMYNAMKANTFFHMGDKAQALKIAKEALTAAENSPQKSPEAIALIKRSIKQYEDAK
jgi:thiol-disulfide isomerase/thioredoxin